MRTFLFSTHTFSEDVQTTKENRCAVHKELEVQTRKKYKQNTPTHAYKVDVYPHTHTHTMHKCK